MSDLRPKPTEITLGGKKYGILFSLNAIDEIQDRFDISITQLGDLMSDERKVFKVLRAILTILINEAIDDAGTGERVDERFVGRKMTVAEMGGLTESIAAAITPAMPVSDNEGPTTSE